MEKGIEKKITLPKIIANKCWNNLFLLKKTNHIKIIM